MPNREWVAAALDPDGGKSPVMGFRISRSQATALAELARRRGVTVSELVREVLGRELQLAHGPPGQD